MPLSGGRRAFASMGQTSSQLEGTQVQKDVDVNIGEAESSVRVLAFLFFRELF